MTKITAILLVPWVWAGVFVIGGISMYTVAFGLSMSCDSQCSVSDTTGNIIIYGIPVLFFLSGCYLSYRLCKIVKKYPSTPLSWSIMTPDERIFILPTFILIAVFIWLGIKYHFVNNLSHLINVLLNKL